jgi:hypothetical protein
LDHLGDMLTEAVNWSPERNLSREEILSIPELAHYATGRPRLGDGTSLLFDDSLLTSAWQK